MAIAHRERVLRHLAALRQRPNTDVYQHDIWVDEDDRGKQLVHAYLPLELYDAATLYVLEQLARLRSINHRLDVLDIGSPVRQNIAVSLRAPVRCLDVRPHPNADQLPFCWRVCDARMLDVKSASEWCLTSTCVLCHIGDGRYDDELDPDGDVRMLREIGRVLRPGGRAILVVGPVCGDRNVVLFNLHRVYTLDWLTAEAAAAGLTIEHATTCSRLTGRFRPWSEIPRRPSFTTLSPGQVNIQDPADYGCLTLVKS